MAKRPERFGPQREIVGIRFGILAFKSWPEVEYLYERHTDLFMCQDTMAWKAAVPVGYLDEVEEAGNGKRREWDTPEAAYLQLNVTFDQMMGSIDQKVVSDGRKKRNLCQGGLMSGTGREWKRKQRRN